MSNDKSDDKSQRTFRYTEIAEALRVEIEGGKRQPGTMLPSESSLVENHDASRVTIRKALEILRDEGLVESRQGSGWFVGRGPILQSLDTLDTIDSQLDAAGKHSQRKVLKFAFVTAPPDVAKTLGVETVLEVVRLNLADGEPFVLVTVWCSELAGANLSRNDVESSTFHDLLGGDLGQATQTIGAVAADDVAASLLGVEAGSPLLRVRRITERANGDNVLVSEHLYPAHSTEFHVTLAQVADAISPAGLRLV